MLAAPCTTRTASTVRRWTGIPISIGVGATKTLAKVANHAAKQLPGGILALDQEAVIDQLLDALVVEEIWGIGHRRGAWLRAHGIRTALAFKEADSAWLRRHLSVTVARTALELRGVSCLPLAAMRAQKQQICVSRSFGREIETIAEMREAVAQYASRACEKSRANGRDHGTMARTLTVFITTNEFQQQQRQYSKSTSVRLPRATAYTPEVVAQAHTLLARLWRPGYRYHKAGVLLGDLVTDAYEQLELFAPPPDQPLPVEQRQAMSAVDAVNARFGRDTLRMAASGLERPWGMRQRNRSPRYTTRWDELARVW
jgi:DNA polymerase V